MRQLRVNLNDVADWLRSLPQETQFDMNSTGACLFACYLQAIHPQSNIEVGYNHVQFNGRTCALSKAVQHIILQLWVCELEATQMIGRDEALNAVEEVLHKVARHGQAVVN